MKEKQDVKSLHTSSPFTSLSTHLRILSSRCCLLFFVCRWVWMSDKLTGCLWNWPRVWRIVSMTKMSDWLVVWLFGRGPTLISLLIPWDWKGSRSRTITSQYYFSGWRPCQWRITENNGYVFEIHVHMSSVICVHFISLTDIYANFPLETFLFNVKKSIIIHFPLHCHWISFFFIF